MKTLLDKNCLEKSRKFNKNVDAIEPWITQGVLQTCYLLVVYFPVKILVYPETQKLEGFLVVVRGDPDYALAFKP